MGIQKELTFIRGPETTEHPSDRLPITATGRPSVLNAMKDFTPWSEQLLDKREQFTQILHSLYHMEGDELYKLAQAEYLYQQDKCFEALVLVVSTIPLMEKKKNMWCLSASLTLEMMILVMSGQAASAASLMKALKERVMAVGRDEALEQNIEALEVWASMYDGHGETMYQWLKQGAPDEHMEFSLRDTFRYIIKLRCYLVQEKHMLLFSLAERLKSALKEAERPMDVCEVNLMLALSCYAQGRVEQAFQYMDEVLKVAEQYRYDRFIGDEGRRMYRLLHDYRRERGKSPYLERVMEIARKTGLLYPDYLKGLCQEVQQLSDSELKVLRLMEEQMSGAEMAEYLDVTVNTIKFHSKNIFRKLNVHNRNMAVKRARELGML